jgi:serine/threonine protein kinase
MLDLSGHELGRYRILSLLGRGGMATVYRASDAKMGRDVAVKVLPPEMALGGAYLARFEREAKAIAALDHPFIVPVFDFGEEDGFSYMVMPLIAGGSLDARIEAARSAGRFLPLVEVGRILGEVSSALSYAHERGLVHRDLKPSNVLIDDEGRCRLADFGIARMLNETTKITQSGVVMGTPRYMSPEQALGGAIDERTDIYSLGVMLFELLTNAAPFEAEGALGIVRK